MWLPSCRMDFSTKKYDEKVLIFNEVRRHAKALDRVKRQASAIGTWDPADLRGIGSRPDKASKHERDIDNVVNYFSNTMIGSLEILSYSRFDITYLLYGDIGREATLGENTVTINVPIRWEKCNVEAKLYAGHVERVMAPADLVSIVKNGLKDRNVLAKTTGWSRDMLNQVNQDQVSDLVKVVENASAGQNKLTRLIKGFLTMLYSMDYESRGEAIEIIRPVSDAIEYSPLGLLTAHRHSGNSYVYSSCPSSDSHTAVLLCMSEAFPPAHIESHVHIPADGSKIRIVGNGAVPPPNIRVRLTTNLIYSSIVRYAADVGVSGDLQEALITACSLFENRYFTSIGLPKVLAHNDMMIPSFSRLENEPNKPFISFDLSRSLGKLHQMLCFMTAKDVITAGMLTTKDGFDGMESVMSYISNQDSVISKMGGYFSEMRILDGTPSFKFMTYLDEDNVADLANISVFEGLWLCDRTQKVVENGAVSVLKLGNKDQSDDTDALDVLRDELTMSHVSYLQDQIPSGRFTIDSPGLNMPVNLDARTVRRVERKSDAVKKCSFKPAASVREKISRIALPGASPAPSIKPVRKLSKSRSSPPRYEADVSSSISEHDIVRQDSHDEEQTLPTISDWMLQSKLAQEATGGELKTPEVIQNKTRKSHASEWARINGILLEEGDELILNKADIKDTDSLKEGADRMLNLPPSEKLPRSKELRSRILEEMLTVAGMTKQERDLVVAVARHTDSENSLWATRNIDKYITNIIGKGIVGFEVDVSNMEDSRLSDLASAIIKGQVTTTSGQLGRMKNEGKDWTGNIVKAKREGLPYIVNSAPWVKFLDDRDIDGDELICGKNARATLAEIYSRSPQLSLSYIVKIRDILTDTSVNALPADISNEEMESMPKLATMAYATGETSMGYKKYNRGDSKYIHMAVSLQRQAISHSFMRELKQVFTVDKKIITELNIIYPGLFGGGNVPPAMSESSRDALVRASGRAPLSHEERMKMRQKDIEAQQQQKK